MPIRVKLAQSAQELNDVYALRRHVYAVEEGYFGGAAGAPQYLVDAFDSYPYTANLVAYDGEVAVGTIRLNLDTGAGLPSEEHYDFSAYRASIARDWPASRGEGPRIGSVSMLAIRREWRRRRDVILALIKLGAGIGLQWGGTHVLATVNYQSHAMYKRAGMEVLDDRIWVEHIGEYVVPMAAPFSALYQWALEGLLETRPWLKQLSSHVERMVLTAGEYVFEQGDEATECFVVDRGVVSISRNAPAEERALALARVGRGDVFGELALIDAKRRSADAQAVTNVELIVIQRDQFLSDLLATPDRALQMLQIFSQRLRRMDDLALVLTYGSALQRLEFALRDFRKGARPDPKRPGVLTTEASTADLANAAGVEKEQARNLLDQFTAMGMCEYTERRIRFLPAFDETFPGEVNQH